jgi:hypothetical protein
LSDQITYPDREAVRAAARRFRTSEPAAWDQETARREALAEASAIRAQNAARKQAHIESLLRWMCCEFDLDERAVLHERSALRGQALLVVDECIALTRFAPRRRADRNA